MKKIKDLILKHKGLSIVTILVILLVLVTFLMFFSMFFGGSSNKYGHRLDGINEVTIKKDRLDSLSSTIDENDSVKANEIRIQGKIIYFNITFKEGTKIDDAKKIAEKALEDFSEKEVGYYDFSFFLVEDKEKDGFIITGNKHPKKDNIGWIKS